MYLNHDEILDFCVQGHMENWEMELVNAASIDVRLGETVLVERYNESQRPVDYNKRERLSMDEIKIPGGGFILQPGQIMLAHTIEKCNFPDDIAALFRIKSSMGRIFLEHMDAGWVDPGFHGSLTLEFKNMSTWHPIRLRVGDRIGQLILLRGNRVRREQSYRTVGNYNGEEGVAQIRYKEGENA